MAFGKGGLCDTQRLGWNGFNRLWAKHTGSPNSATAFTEIYSTHVGSIQIAGSSAESPLCETGLVSTLAVTVCGIVMVAARVGKVTRAALSSTSTAGQK